MACRFVDDLQVISFLSPKSKRFPRLFSPYWACTMRGMPVVRLEQLQQFAAVDLRLDPGAIGGPVVIPQCAQIVMYWNLESGRQGHIVLYGRYSGAFAGTTAQANSILTGLTTGGAWTALAAFLSTATTLGAITIRDVSVANQPLVSSTTSGASGSSASPSLPNEVAAVVTLRTALAGKSGRGRSYVPGFATNALGAGNVIAAAAVTALQNWANTWPSIISGQGYTWVLGLKARQAYTGSTGTPHPARAATSVPITVATVRDNHWDSQRRRGLK